MPTFKAFQNPDHFVVETVLLPSANYRGVRVEGMTEDQLREAVQVLGRDLKRLSIATGKPVRHQIGDRRPNQDEPDNTDGINEGPAP